jgi:hypothetical protein
MRVELQHILDQIKLSDLPEGYKYVGEICGMDTAKKLMSEMGGLQLYIPLPTHDKIIIPYIKNRYRELCNEDLSQRRICQLIASEIGVTEKKIRMLLKKINLN